MGPYPVPDQFRSGLTAVANMPDKLFSRLVEELDAEGPTLEPGNLAERVAGLLGQDAAKNTSTSMVTALLSLALLAESLDSSEEALVDRVAQSNDLDLDADGRGRLRDRLQTLLGISSLVTTAKGLRLLAADDKTFHDVRIVTDARPVFAGDVSRGPVAALIVHSLIVEYHERSEAIRQVTYSLDSSDVSKLIKALDRANAKAKALEEALGKGGLRLLKLEEASE